MEIAIQSSDELEQLRTRLRKMTDAQLVSFGKAARSLCRKPDDFPCGRPQLIAIRDHIVRLTPAAETSAAT
jgi:hypothetical protein